MCTTWSRFVDGSPSDDFPEKARVAYLDGKSWVDLPMERHVHNQCKFEISAVLNGLVQAGRERS